MKKNVCFFLIFGILLFVADEMKAQKNPIIDSDNKISNLKKSLPEGWEMFAQINGVLTIQKETIAYVLFENMINAPANIETKEEIEKRIIENGKQVKPHFEFKYYNRMSDEHIESARRKNDSIYALVKSLPKKYNIQHLKNKFASSKGEDIYSANTEGEMEIIKKYEIEKDNLLDKIIKLPDYNSENYSLYIDSKVGMGDEFHLVCPFEISKEMYGLLRLFDKCLIKIGS
ncbi:MAG: hypothetical protein HY959_02370 [Ignavibacteriae bacterium]|nr:hypothetical protein [Ignavibacteriota bacterium]